MTKKILLVSLVLFGIASFQGICISAESDTTVDKLIADYADNPHLASTLVGTAGQSTWDRKYDDAKRLYQAVIDKTSNPFVTKARVGLARTNALILIEEKKYSLAQQQVESMAVDFNSEAGLQEALFHIGKEFTWQHRYSEAKDTFALIVEKSPLDSLSREAGLWSARANVCSLIGQVKDEEVIAAIDKLLNDFNSDSGLSEALFWISKEYEWKKGTTINRAGWYDTPNSVYQKLMQRFSDSPYGQQADLDQKRLTHRMNIFNLLGSSNQNEIDAAIGKMVTELKGHPEVAGEFYWIACGYEEQPDKSPQAKQMYQRIIQEYPNSIEAKNAALDILRLEIWDTLNSGDSVTAQSQMNKFITDFKQNPYAGDCLGRVLIAAYKRGMEFKNNSQREKAAQYFVGADDVWKRLVTNNLQDGSDAVYFYYYAASNCQQLKRWDDAIKYYQKVVDNWPDYEYACGAQAGVGWCLEVLRDANAMPKEAANSLIEEAYAAVLKNYPDCYTADYAAIHLADRMMEKGDRNAAAVYYRKFLELARQGDGRIAEIQNKLAQIEGGAGK